MKVEIADTTIGIYMNNFSCHDCANTRTDGGPKLHHQYEVCTVDGFHFEDIDECGSFKLADGYNNFSRSLDEMIPVWKKLAKGMFNTQNEHYMCMLVVGIFTKVMCNMYMSGGDFRELVAIETAKKICDYLKSPKQETKTSKRDKHGTRNTTTRQRSCSSFKR